MLESLDGINIGSLNLAEPQRSLNLPFDVTRDIPERKWVSIKNYLKENYPLLPSDWDNFFREMARVKILSPERVEWLDPTTSSYVPSSEGLFSVAKKSISWMREGASQDFQISNLLMSLKILFPDRFPELDLSEDHLARLKRSAVTRSVERSGWLSFVRSVVPLKIAFPDRVSDLVEQADYQEIARAIRGGSGLVEWYAYGRILFPDKFNRSSFDDSRWMKFKEELRKADEQLKDPLQYLVVASSMKILTAERLVFGDAGLELVMPTPQKPLVEDIPNLPETRKF